MQRSNFKNAQGMSMAKFHTLIRLLMITLHKKIRIVSIGALFISLLSLPRISTAVCTFSGGYLGYWSCETESEASDKLASLGCSVDGVTYIDPNSGYGAGYVTSSDARCKGVYFGVFEDPCTGNPDPCCKSKDPCCGATCDSCCRAQQGGNGSGSSLSSGGSCH
jgi:hypothetical protein